MKRNPLYAVTDEVGAAFGNPLSSLRDRANLRCLAATRSNRAHGHRGYLDNPRLMSTVERKPPVARGHRSWLEVGRNG